MPRGTVYIIILNWNAAEDTTECVNSCLNLDYPSFRIVIVDNGSTDGSDAVLEKAFPELTLLQTMDNLGYAGGNNVGIRYALNEGAEYIWLLNNDTVVAPEALSELVKVAEMEPAIGMAGSKILSYFERSTIHFAGGWIDPDSGASGHIGIGDKDGRQYGDLAETGYITGCSLLVKPAVITEVGLMDESYFLYCEESEWCLKTRLKGYRLMYVPKSVVYHKESASTLKIRGAKVYYLTRNRLYFIGHNGTNKRWARRFMADLEEFARLIFRKQMVQAFYMLLAYVHWAIGYRGRCDSLVKRTAA